jgi:aminodeoxyfutalosine deaminase
MTYLAKIMQHFSADLIHDGTSFLPKGTIISVESNGQIVSINSTCTENVQFLPGLICPSFINAHCHLELSYLQGKIPKHTGLVDFLKNMNQLNYEPNLIDVYKAIAKQDIQMYKNGISAVADICNTTNTSIQKKESAIHYENFIEVYGALPQAAENRWKLAQKVKEIFIQGSITAHAAYSLSKDLFTLLNTHLTSEKLISIHNQESAEEDKLIMHGKGDFVNLLHAINNEISTQAKNKSALAYTLSQLPNARKILFVHNTFTNDEDIILAQNILRESYWCVCPAANDYIEQHINPNYKKWHAQGLQIVIGTDSLASNDRLCMVHELFVLHQYLPQLSPEISLQWATKNGAAMLGLIDLGEIKVGKKPQLINISNWQKITTIPENAIIQRL